MTGEAQSQSANQAQSAESADAAPSLLEAAIKATKQTERSRTEELLKTLTQEALRGTVSWSKNLGQTLEGAIKGIDELVVANMAGKKDQ